MTTYTKTFWNRFVARKYEKARIAEGKYTTLRYLQHRGRPLFEITVQTLERNERLVHGTHKKHAG